MGRPRTGTIKPGKIGIRCSTKTQEDWKILSSHFKTSEDALRYYIDNFEKMNSITTPKGVGKLY
jgi:hypothetical protein